jgi:hypothetical protein
MKYYIASTDRHIIQSTGMGGGLYQRAPQTSPSGILHAVEVGVARMTVCERGIVEERLNPFPTHDWDADNLATQSGRCEACVAKINTRG